MQRPVNYLRATRRDTCYPAFRTAITLLTVLAYAVIAAGAVVGFLAVLSDSGAAPLVVLVTVVSSLLAIGVVKLLSEASLMLVDLVDVVIERAWANLPEADSKDAAAANLDW